MDAVHRQRLADGQACHEAALEYLSYGWSVLALCPPDHVGIRRVAKDHAKHCQNPGKVPWHTWSPYQERNPTIVEVDGWWRQMPTSNVGLALGPGSGLLRIDIEGILGQRALEERSAGDLPATLEFCSGRRDGTGRGLLYAIPSGVHLRTTIQPLGLHAELRLQAKGAQTVLPPSKHADGGYYVWKPGRSPRDGKAALAPRWLVDALRADRAAANSHASRDNWEAIFAGVPEGGRNDSMAAVFGKLLRGVGDLDDTGTLQAVWLAGSAVNAQNQPPLEEGELRKVFTSIVRAEKRQRSTDEQRSFDSYVKNTMDDAPPPSDPGAASPESPPSYKPAWHLIISHGDPDVNWLRSPLWSCSPLLREREGCLKLTDAQICLWGKIATAAWAQAKMAIQPRFKKWVSLLNELAGRAEHRQCDAEAKRYVVVGLYVLGRLRFATEAEKDEDGNWVLGSGAPILMDKNYLVKLEWLLQHGQGLAEPIKRTELLDVLKKSGMKPVQLGHWKKRERWWQGDEHLLLSLERISEIDAEPVSSTEDTSNGLIPRQSSA